MSKKKKYYAVRVGRKPGIYSTWEQCKKQVNGFSKAAYKSFETLQEAKRYLNFATNQIPSLDSPYAYVDGSYNIKTGVYGYGGYLHINGKTIPISGSGKDKKMASMHNVAGEIMGARKAIELAINEGAKSIVIYYDYEGIEKWATGAWRAKKQGTMDYRDFVEAARSVIDIYFVKVKAHSGIDGNERADILAKRASGVISSRSTKSNENSGVQQKNSSIEKEKPDDSKHSFDEERFYVYVGPELPLGCPVPTSMFLNKRDAKGNFPDTCKIVVGVDMYANDKTPPTRKSFLKTDKEFGDTVYLCELIDAKCVSSFIRTSKEGQPEIAYYLKYDLISE